MENKGKESGKIEKNIVLVPIPDKHISFIMKKYQPKNQYTVFSRINRDERT